MNRHTVSQLRAVAAVVSGLLVLTVIGLTVVLDTDVVVAPGPRLDWWLLAAMFAVAELIVVDVQIRREAQTISLCEIALVLGLVFADPGAVIIARLVGPLVIFVLHRRQGPLKTMYNVVKEVTSATVASAVYYLVAGHAMFPDVLVVVAVYAAVTAAAVTEGLALQLVMGLYEGVLRWRDVVRDLFTYPPLALMVATFGVVAAYALQLDARSAVPLVVCAVTVLLAYRAYAGLSGRHLSLERLYQFSQALSETPEVDHVLGEALGRAKDLLHADHAEVLFLASEGSSAALVALDSSDRLHRRTVTMDVLPLAIREPLVDDGSPVLVPRRSKDPVHKAFLAERGFRDAILAPLRGDTGVTAVLTVADRMGDVRSFDHADGLLLETVANHAGVALQNGRLIDQLRHQALHDGLTGLPNRVFITRRIAEALQGLDDDGPGVAAMIMDLDGFKEVNDTLGHQHGDRLLVEVAERLRVAAGDEALVARLGGDEFAVLLPQCTDLDYAARIGERLLAALEQPIHLDDLDVAVGASLGVAMAPLHATDGPSLLKRADVAMYSAKAATGGLSVYDAGQDTRTPQRLALASELRQALQKHELRLFVQPKSRLRDGSVVGAEALVRWEHPRHGLIGPDDFVPVAERSGLMRQLTATVLDEALTAVAAWNADGLELGIAVNLSPRNLLDPDLVDDVARMLRRHEVAPHRLTLEITEGSVMADPTRTIDVLLVLRRMGVHLSVDDFGTGYSSLSYLKRLPVDEVKIDKSFVLNMDSDADNASIVRSIVDLGANLSLDVVAEGIETREVWQQLVGLGCDYGQGFLVSHPMPIGDFPAWMSRRRPGATAALPDAPLPSSLPSSLPDPLPDPLPDTALVPATRDAGTSERAAAGDQAGSRAGSRPRLRPVP